MDSSAPGHASLTAIYDLSLCNPNFEFFNFLVLAEIERVSLGVESIHLVFVPGEQHRYYRGASYDDAENDWRFQNILLPGCSLMASCKRISVLDSRSDAQPIVDASTHIYPCNYRLEEPVAGYCANDLVKYWLFDKNIPSLQVPDYAATRAIKWLQINTGGRKAVTVTLRQQGDSDPRDSQISNWIEFVRSLDPDIYFPIIIPDTGAIFRGTKSVIDEFQLYPEFAVNILMRAALYEEAHLNMFSANGPATLGYLNQRTNLIAFNTALAGDPISGPETFETAFGVPVGDQLPFCGWHQKLVFERDDTEVLRREFDAFTAVLEGDTTPDTYSPPKTYIPQNVALRLEKGRAFVQSRDIYEILARSDSSSNDAKLGLARTQLGLGNFAQASEIVFPLREKLPEGIDIHLLLGELYLETKNLEDAYGCWTAVEKLAAAVPKDFERLFIQFAWSMERLGKLSELETRFWDRADLLGNSHLAFRAMGEIFAKRLFPEKSDEYFKAEMKILESDPEQIAGEIPFQIRLIELYCAFEQPNLAQEVIEPLLPSNAFAHIISSAYGVVLEKLGKDQRALEYHRKAVHLTGKINGIMILRLSKVLRKLKEIDEAIWWADYCNDIAPNQPEVLNYLADILTSSGQMSKALKYSAQLQQLNMDVIAAH